jgi:outer membrane immunogenic protein
MPGRFPENGRMKSLTRSFIFVFAFTGLAAMATADPIEQKPITFAWMGSGQTFNWTGFYIGLNAGGLFPNYDISEYSSAVDVEQQFFLPTPSFPGDAFLDFLSPSHSGGSAVPIGGGQGGYNFQFGHFVVGVEGDGSFTAANETSRFHDTGMTTFFAGKGQTITAITDFTSLRRAETNWMASARVRVGWAQGCFLFYATGGALWGDVDLTRNDVASTDFFRRSDNTASVNPNPSGFPSGNFIFNQTNSRLGRIDDVRLGWTAGAGIEVALSDTISLAVEYRHNDLGSETYTFSDGGGPIFSQTTHVDMDSDQVTLRFNVLLSHLFGHKDYAGTTRSENMSLAYAPQIDAKDAKDNLSSKDKNVAIKEEEPFSWTGFYFGGNIGAGRTGYDFGRFDTDVDLGQQANEFDGPETTGVDIATFTTPSFGDPSDAGIVGGGQVGYNYQWGHFVFGAEADFQALTTDKATQFTHDTVFSTVDSDFFTETNLVTWRKIENHWQFSARARAGYAVNRVLLYVTGGAVWADSTMWAMETARTDFFTKGGFAATVTDTVSSKDEQLTLGWTAGGGAEWAFTNCASVGVEYRHNGFGDETYHFNSHGGPVFLSGTKIGMDSDQVVFKVNILLGHLCHFGH